MKTLLKISYKRWKKETICEILVDKILYFNLTYAYLIIELIVIMFLEFSQIYSK